MHRLRRLAEKTSASRERYVDLLRALAITMVLLGHWLISTIGHHAHGRLTGHSALASLLWAYPITWLVQVMPLFFVVGGYANAGVPRPTVSASRSGSRPFHCGSFRRIWW